MIPRASERIWIIVFWVLLLQCSPINPVLVQTAENDGESVRHAVEDAENLYHRIIDDSEFHHDSSSSRHKINVAHSNLDIALNAIDGTGRFQDIAAIIDDPRHRVLSNDEHRPQHHTDGHLTRDRRELSNSQAPPTGTSPIGSTPQTVFPSASNKADHASPRVSISMAPTSADGGDVRGHGNMADAAMENARKLHPGVKPPVVIDSLKASNLDQLISGGAPSPAMVHSKLNPSTSAQLESGRTPTPTPGGSPKHPITVSHSSATTSDNHRQRYGDGAKVEQPEPSFILLDDSVYIAPVSHRNSSGHGTSRVLPPAGTDLTLDAVFGGRNFDEQIIFLNGPDLVDASAEQEMPSPMGKVPRAVAEPEEPLVLPLRPIVRDPAEEQLADGNVVLVYADQHETVRLNCEVDADITTGVWLKDGQIVHATDKKSRTADVRFVRESFGALTIANVMLEDDGVWQCEAENARGFFFNGRPIKLIVLDPPKEPYLLIDSRRLDAGNMFIPVKENSELTLACVSEGGNPKPTLTWEVLLSPGIDRHAQKLSTDVLELQEIRKDKDKEPYKINSGAVSEAKLAAVFRVHHQARILCIMEHPTLKVRQNASILLDVQYTPSFAITRTPGFGYPLREGIEVSLKCDVDSNPPSTPLWQKDDGDPPVPQTGDGFLNFSAIRREHSGWYKCTSRHLNFQYSSIGYYLSVRYEPVDVTSEPVEQDLSLSPASSSSSAAVPSSAVSGSPGSFPYANGAGSFPAGLVPGGSPIKGGGQMEVELGGSVTLQCPQGSLGCWSHLDSATARLKGLGSGSYAQTGQLSLKDVVYQDAGTYKCVGQSATTAAAAGNRKKLEVLQTVSIAVKGAPTVTARNATPIVLPGTALHLAVEFCSNPPASAARWLHGDRIYTPGNQYGTEVLAYGFTDLPTPHCKEARLTYAHMHEKVPRTFYFVVSSPGGVAEAVFRVNYTSRHRSHTAGGHSGAGTGPYSGGTFSVSGGVGASGGMANGNGGLGSGYKGTGSSINAVPGNGLDADDETLMEPEEIHFPIFGTSGVVFTKQLHWSLILPMVLLLRLLQSKVAL